MEQDLLEYLKNNWKKPFRTVSFWFLSVSFAFVFDLLSKHTTTVCVGPFNCHLESLIDDTTENVLVIISICVVYFSRQ